MASPVMFKLAMIAALGMALASTASASTVFSGANNNIGGNTFSASNKTYISVATNGTNSSTFDGQVYAVRSWHEAGDRITASKSGDSRIYSMAPTAGTQLGTNPAGSAVATTDDYAASTAWKSM